jgi:hypothetical protein
MKHCTASIYLCCLVAHSELRNVDAFHSSVGSVAGSRKRRFAHRHQNVMLPVPSDHTSALGQSFNNEDFTTTRRQRDHSSSLKAFTVDALDVQFDRSEAASTGRTPTQSINLAGLQTVLTTALMVTGNTIGAGALVLPEIAAKPGMAISVGLFIGK